MFFSGFPMKIEIKKNTERIKNIIELKCNIDLDWKYALRCITTKHGYQSKRTYGKVVHKQKMDSYIVG